MSKSPPSRSWSRNPDVPKCLDTGKESEHIRHTCEASSRDQSIHCIAISSPAPLSYHSNLSPVSPPKNLAVPVPNLETSRYWPQHQPKPPRPVLRLDVLPDTDGRPRVRARRSRFSPLSSGSTRDICFGENSYSSRSLTPNTPDECTEHMKRNKAGRGIPEAPVNPDSSPIQSPEGE